MATERITQPSTDRPFTEESGGLVPQARSWINALTNQSTIIGDGSPEGKVTAPIAQEYMDRAGTVGNIKYIKRDSDIAGDESKGWFLI